jgi:hypothetical protein
MSTSLQAAALVTAVVGAAHSLLGEILIFRHVRTSGVVPGEPAPPLAARNIRILWATWHLATAFGVGFAYILYAMAQGVVAPNPAIILAVAASLAAGGFLVLIATRGRHPGWIGLFLAAGLSYLGRAG